MDNSHSANRLGVALALLAAFGFSFKAIFVKLAYQAAPVDAVSLIALRMLFCLPFVLALALITLREMPRLTARQAGLLTLLGVVGYYGSSVLDFYGLQYITAGLERLILFTYPMLTILIGILFMGKKAEPGLLVAALLSYAGIAIAFAHDVSQNGDMASVAAGAGFVFACAVLYAVYSAGSEVAIRRLGAMPFSILSILISTVAVCLHFLLTHRPSALRLPMLVYGYSMAMALFSTVLPILWQSAAIRRIGAARTVLIGTLGPGLTIFFGWRLLGEPVSLSQLAGTGLVMAGVMMASRRK